MVQEEQGAGWTEGLGAWGGLGKRLQLRCLGHHVALLGKKLEPLSQGETGEPEGRAVSRKLLDDRGRVSRRHSFSFSRTASRTIIEHV